MSSTSAEPTREFVAVEDVLAAIALVKRSKLSFWDAMIIHAAAESGCAVCWTEDMNDGQRLQGVQIRNPFLTPPAPRLSARRP